MNVRLGLLLLFLIFQLSFAEATNTMTKADDSPVVLKFKSNGYKIIYEYGKPENVYISGQEQNEKLKKISGLLTTIIKELEGRGLSPEVIMNNIKIFMERFDYCNYCNRFE